MLLNLKSTAKRREEKKVRRGKWHRKFIIFGRVNNNTIAFFQFVEARAEYVRSWGECWWDWEYRISDQE